MVKKNDKAASELLRPHFVFNVMNVLRYMIKKDAGKASDMVYDLSLYMRCKLDALEESRMTTFQKAWGAVGAYLRLEQVALPNLKFVVDVTNEEYPIEAGLMLEQVEQLVKEHVRITKEERTLWITDTEDWEQQGIKIMVKETNVWIQL